MITLLLAFSVTHSVARANDAASTLVPGGTGNVTITGSLDDTFSEQANLTDEQQTEASNFVHQGKQQKLIQKNCKSQNLGDCNINKVGEQGAFINDALEQNLGKLYAAIFGGLGILGGGGPSVKVKEKGSDKTEDKPDYCMYAAMGYELFSGQIQQAMQQSATQASKDIQDIQLKSLVDLKAAHQARRDTATVQAVAYGAVTSCYGVMMIASAAGSGVQVDGMTAVKMGAAAAISGIYIAKHVKHEEASKKVQLVIDSLPKAGDCNPWTGTSCFCSEPTSKTTYPDQYLQVCVLNKGDPETPIVNIGCATKVQGQITYDKECKCKQTKTCYQASINGNFANGSLGQNLMNQANQDFSAISNGNFDRGRLNALASQTAALNNMARKKLPLPKSAPVSLTPAQKAEASALEKYMSPSAAAQIAAMNPVTPPGANDSAMKAALSKIPDNLKKKVGDSDISGGYSQSGAGYGDSPKEEAFTLPGMGGKNNSNSTEVLSFADKAMSNNADISSNKDTPLFDIISNRYRNSAAKRLQLDEADKK